MELTSGIQLKKANIATNFSTQSIVLNELLIERHHGTNINEHSKRFISEWAQSAVGQEAN